MKIGDDLGKTNKELDHVSTLSSEEDLEQLIVDKIHANIQSGMQNSYYIETSDPTFQTMQNNISELKIKLEEILTATNMTNQVNTPVKKDLEQLVHAFFFISTRKIESSLSGA